MASHTMTLSQGSRLFELLDQQQEPFLLEDYLLESGYSCKSLKKDTLRKCWPMNSCGFRRKRVGPILSCLLPKIVPWKLLIKVLNCYIKAPDTIAKKVFKRGNACFWKRMQEPKQLSTVSILELHSDEGCSLQNPSSTSSIHSENSEFPLYSTCISNSYWYRESSSSNSFLQSKQLLQQEFSLEKDSTNVSTIEQFIEDDLFNHRIEWCYFQAEKKEIGMEIEEFIFQDIKEESVAEMLGSNCRLERG